MKTCPYCNGNEEAHLYVRRPPNPGYVIGCVKELRSQIESLRSELNELRAAMGLSEGGKIIG